MTPTESSRLLVSCCDSAKICLEDNNVNTGDWIVLLSPPDTVSTQSVLTALTPPVRLVVHGVRGEERPSTPSLVAQQTSIVRS